MNPLAEQLQNAIDYIEAHLDEELNMRDIASRALVSQFHFQRIFSVVCGMTVSEYIRSRRLTLAAQELAATGTRIIDLAVKYGYDSPDSFARAFQRFHGILPSQAREKGASLRSFAPMHIRLTLEGGTIMEYRIEEKAPFTVMGVSRRFSGETAYQKIPEFWTEWLAQGEQRPVMGMYALCLDGDGDGFDYWIADPYTPNSTVPAGCAVRSIPGTLWAIFPCRGKLPEALQEVNTRIWSEWLPSLTEYKLSGNWNIEAYLADDYNEIWVPIERV